MNNFFIFIDGYIGSATWFPYFLLLTGVFFTIYLKFPQFRFFRHAIKVTSGKFDNPQAEGDASHFQALATALSGTVGTGNIGGVALALYLGGPAALFWMWMTAFFGMTTKFVEVTLSHKYRVKTADGTMAGGPMYYMERRLNMKWLAVVFAIATVFSSFGTGNLPQINSIAAGLQATFGLAPIVTGAILAILLAVVIIGGIKRIVTVTAALVPFMAILYFVGAFTVILPNIGNVIPSFAAIFSAAFTGSAAVGGFLGASFAYAFNKGVNRGLFSNEAGQGSAPIAHAAARATEPVAEGVVAILEPFIDTIVICTLTGLVILSTGVWNEKHENTFQSADMEFIAGSYSDRNEEDRQSLSIHLVGGGVDTIKSFSGEIIIIEGKVVNDNEFTLLNSRSVAEDVVYLRDGELFSGVLTVVDAQLEDGNIILVGKSLLHSVQLTTKAFTRGWLGHYGQYVVSIGLLLFAFSTAIAWSYYGDRAMTYLFGPRSILPYRVVYTLGFFVASFADTTIIWSISLVTIVLMAIPNLVGILLLRKEMKESVDEYWKKVS